LTLLRWIPHAGNPAIVRETTPHRPRPQGHALYSCWCSACVSFGMATGPWVGPFATWRCA